MCISEWLPPFSWCNQSCYVTLYFVISNYLSRVLVNLLDKLSAPSTISKLWTFLSTCSLSLSNSIQGRIISWGRNIINTLDYRLLKYPQRIQKCSKQHTNLTYKWMSASSWKLWYWSHLSRQNYPLRSRWKQRCPYHRLSRRCTRSYNLRYRSTTNIRRKRWYAGSRNSRDICGIWRRNGDACSIWWRWDKIQRWWVLTL